MEDGDHIIQCRIIEGRELSGLDVNNESDAVITVNITNNDNLNQKKSTKTLSGRNNVKWDEIWTWNFITWIKKCNKRKIGSM